MMLVSVFLIAFGIFLYVPTDIMPLTGEGAMLAISQVSGVAFSTIKIIFDCSMVAVSLVTCLVMLHALGSVGVGTGCGGGAGGHGAEGDHQGARQAAGRLAGDFCGAAL